MCTISPFGLIKYARKVEPFGKRLQATKFLQVSYLMGFRLGQRRDILINAQHLALQFIKREAPQIFALSRFDGTLALMR